VTTDPNSIARPWALITGASSGLGREIALQLAQQKRFNILVVARRSAALETLVEELKAHGVLAQAVTADLSTDDGVDAIISAVSDLPLAAAILNAGMTHLGAFETAELNFYDQMIALNAQAIVRLSYGVLPQLKQQVGHLMLVSSMAGFGPVPYQAVYAGTKAFVTNFALSLNAERTTRPATVTLFAPGGIATEMTATPEFAGQSKHLADAQSVARAAVVALSAGSDVAVPGRMNRLMTVAMKVLPRRWVTPLVERSFRKSIAAADRITKD